MSKERARKRAKDNALKLAKKRAAKKAEGNESHDGGKFNANAQSMKGAGASNQGGSFAPARRGSARSG